VCLGIFHPFLRKRVDWAKQGQTKGNKKKRKKKRASGTKVLPTIRTNNSLSNFSSKRVLPMEWNAPLLGYFSKFTLATSFPKSMLPNCYWLSIWLICLVNFNLFATSTLPNHKVHRAIWLFFAKLPSGLSKIFPVCPKNQIPPSPPLPPPFLLSLSFDFMGPWKAS
jgi:hypothetical protein